MTTEQYGIVFEDFVSSSIKEALEKECTLEEIKDKRITITDDSCSCNLIIESDNYRAMKALCPLYRGKIDLIILDPPYFTGNKFIYNDSFSDKKCKYYFSKWCSDFKHVLLISRQLLSNKGVIIVNIDEKVVSHADLLCQEVFLYKNRIVHAPVVVNWRGNNNQLGFSGVHEYFLIYAKNKKKTLFNQLSLCKEDVLIGWREDHIGYWKEGANIMAFGPSSLREDCPTLFFPVFINKDDQIYTTPNDMPINKNDQDIWPIGDGGTERRWYWARETFNERAYDVIIKKHNIKEKTSLFYKQRPKSLDADVLTPFPSTQPKSVLYKPEYATSTGTERVKRRFGKKIFDTVKSLALYKDIISICSASDAIVLDPYAGFGTTGEAIIDLNLQLDSNRKFILINNNENDICEKITYLNISKKMEEVLEGVDDRVDKENVLNRVKNLKFFTVKLS